MHARMMAGLLVLAAALGLVALRAGPPARAFAPPRGVDDQSDRYIAPTATPVSSFKTCPGGATEFLGSVCPIQYQFCSNGEMIYVTQVCPGQPPQPGTQSTPGQTPDVASASPAPVAAAAPLTLCGSESSFNPAIQIGALTSSTTVSVGQPILCGASATSVPGCQPAGETVDFGDGSGASTNPQLQGAPHVYNQAGVYSPIDTLLGCAPAAPASVTVLPVTGLAQPINPPLTPPQAASPAAVAAVGSCSQPPVAPANVTVSAQPDLFHALISWADPTGDATGFQIGFGNGSLVGTTGAGVSQFSAGSWMDAGTGTLDQVAPTGWWDFFSVTATNSCGTSSAVWAEVRMPCPDGSAPDPNGNANNSCTHVSTSGAG